MYIDMTENGILVVAADNSLERYALRKWRDENNKCPGLVVSLGDEDKTISYATDVKDVSPFDS